MKLIVKNYLFLLIPTIFLIACDSQVTVETADNFEQVELPDSSIVYLNHNSKLTYDESFDPRKVILEGEAFFSVNDGDSTFIVETPTGEEVTVLGTEFNLIANVKTVALEVEIGFVSLRIGERFKKVGRNQRLVYGRHDNGLHLGQAKHGHRNWIGVMNKDFKKMGKVLKHSPKHALKGRSKQMLKGNKGSKGGRLKTKPKTGNKLLKKNIIKGGAKGNGKPNKGGGNKGSKGGSNKGNSNKGGGSKGGKKGKH